MSKKPWKNPANPDYNKPAVDPSIPKPDPLPKAEPPGSTLSDRDAMMMLGECAKLLFTMLGKTLDALNLVDHRLLARVVKAEPEPTSLYATPQKQPRGRTHPLLTLFKYGLSAGYLLPRVLRMTHGHLFGKGNSDVEKTIATAEQIVAKLKDALHGKPPEAAPAAA
jgi:hypothetical protein